MFQMQTRKTGVGIFPPPSFLTPKVRRSFDECEDSVEVIARELFHLLLGGRKVSGT